MPRVMGVDYGDRRIGLAVSDEDETMAFPREVLTCAGPKAAARQVADRADAAGVARIVVGYPLNMNGTRGPRAEATDAFIEKLAAASGRPIERWDERLSTRTAEAALIEGGVSRQGRKGVIDKLAAQVLLQHYLDTPPEIRARMRPQGAPGMP